MRAANDNFLLSGMGSDKFSDPFLLSSSLYIPKDFFTALEFALYLYFLNPIYRQTTTRVVSHFLTDINFEGEGGDTKERSDFKSYLEEELDIMGALQRCGIEQFVYGNSFLRIYYPFNRHLVDRRNGRYQTYSIGAFGEDAKFNFDRMTYSVPDPLQMGSSKGGTPEMVELEFFDRASKDMSRIKLCHVDPKRMTLRHNWISGKTEYIYRFEEFFINAVKSGHRNQIDDTPKAMLDAIKNNQDFLFNPGQIFHFKEPTISGISNSGWGIPNVLTNYRSIHRLDVLHAVNEAVGLDYMLPFRFITPKSAPVGAGAGEASQNINLRKWMYSMKNAISRQRKGTHTDIDIVPFSMEFQELGGNGKSLAPVDLIEYQEKAMLGGMGYAPEWYSGSIAVQQVPTAVRNMESVYTHLFRSINMGVKWIASNILSYEEREPMVVCMDPPSVADDMEKRSIWLQLAAGGEVSRYRAYKAYNIKDPIEEIKRRATEDIEIMKAQQKVQEDFEREQTMGSAGKIISTMQQGQAGPGGQAPMGGGQGNVTPLDIQQQAQEEAQKLLQIQDVGQRRTAMKQIEVSNPTLYALTKQKMEEMRAQGASEGRKMAGQE